LLSSEIPKPDDPPVRVRLLGENLVAFRDTDGKVGLVAENCPHRGASVYFGRNEECGLRCVYHGWKFDVDGNCVDMPNEPAESNFKTKVKITAYPTHESGGIVWAYMGPRETMTPFRDFGTESLPAEHVFAGKLHSTCNWVQSMEGNIDPSHISWLHQFFAIDDIPDDGSDKPGYPANALSWKFWRHDRAPGVDLQLDWYGYRYASTRTTPNGHTHVRINAYALPYSTMVATVPFTTNQGMFVPIDDEHCWRYILITEPPSNPWGYGGSPLFAVKESPYRSMMRAANRPGANGQGGNGQSGNGQGGDGQNGNTQRRFNRPSGVTPREYTLENDYKIDRDTQRKLSFTGIEDFVSQDLMVTETMGPIYDRSQEHLGTADKAIITMRQLLLNAAKGLAEGKEPPALGADHDYMNIRGAEKILEPGEDWKRLGTVDDPLVQEVLAQRAKSAGGNGVAGNGAGEKAAAPARS
jgi:nitrite reductase/ring-hydroxylating ferredoxin subunit